MASLSFAGASASISSIGSLSGLGFSPPPQQQPQQQHFQQQPLQQPAFDPFSAPAQAGRAPMGQQQAMPHNPFAAGGGAMSAAMAPQQAAAQQQQQQRRGGDAFDSLGW